MNLAKVLIILIFLLVIGGVGYYLMFSNKSLVSSENPLPSAIPTQETRETVSPTPLLNTQSAIAEFLANKYEKPISEVKVTISKEVPGFAGGSVLFGQGGPGEGGMWLAVLGNGWEVVWDGNGNVDCSKMRQEYGFPDTILKPNFCN